MDGDDDDDDDDASSPREEEKEKVEDTEERKTLEKWRHSSLYPEETRASRWASKLLKTEVVTTNKQQTRKKDEHFKNYSNALELNRRKQPWKRYRKSRRIYREVDTRSRSAG